MTIKRWFVAWTIPVIQSGVPAVEVVRATDYDAAQARIAALEAALFDLVGDEVPIVWAAQHYDIAREIALKRTTLETSCEQVKCLHLLHHGWHDQKADCVHPMARSEFKLKTEVKP